MTLLLDISPETALTRKATGRDRYETDHAMQTRVRASYLRQSENPRWTRVDGERAMADVAAAIAEVVEPQLEPR